MTERETLADYLSSVRWDNAGTRMDHRQFWLERADAISDLMWGEGTLDRLQELAEERGYSRGFDIGWEAHKNLPRPNNESEESA